MTSKIINDNTLGPLGMGIGQHFSSQPWWLAPSSTDLMSSWWLIIEVFCWSS